MKPFLTILVILIFLTGCAIISTCLTEALNTANNIQDKENLLFVEGDYEPFSRHVQLWVCENGEYKRLTGGLIKLWKFNPTHYFNYRGYMERVKKNEWLKEGKINE